MMARTVTCLIVFLALALAGCAAAAPSAPPATAGRTPSPAAPAPAVAPTPPISVAPALPGTPPALERGRALLARGEVAAAAAAFREALRTQPDLVEARAGLGTALASVGDLDAAVEELRAALRRQPDALPLRVALARVLVARQEWPAAREELERVLSAQPDLLDARYSLGVVRYAQGDVAGAIDAYRRVLAAEPQQLDARYSLALVLKLAQRDAEATPEFVTAAEAGHARAQYFAGTAYASGLGVPRDLSAAVAWWFRASEQGVAQAEQALAQLRQVALGRSRRPPAESQAALQAFADYRATLARQFPDVTLVGDETLGMALLRLGRTGEAVPVLIREAAALSEPAARQLEMLYDRGVDGQLAVHDARILAYLQSAAAEGRRPPVR
jgi:tetratricopeptide (TPR) repeat protein